MLLLNKILAFISYKIFRLKPHENNIGVHFYLPIPPYHLLRLDLGGFRINIFLPFLISMSFGFLNHAGLQVYAGIKHDPTRTELEKEWDYLLSVVTRIHYLDGASNEFARNSMGSS